LLYWKEGDKNIGHKHHIDGKVVIPPLAFISFIKFLPEDREFINPWEWDFFLLSIRLPYPDK
ncbi:487_t:CDS:1, partial [Acaulospora morrowiae]